MSPLAVSPFSVAASSAQLDLLKQKLSLTTWPDESVENDDWAYGIPTAVVKELAAYWAENYDWRKWEAELNKHPQFKAEVNGINLHFVHKPSSNPAATPLLLIHGWPGSFFEFHNLIDSLAEFHVVVPSLPGYGFSSAPTTRGFGISEMAKTLDELMVGLGYSKYIAQGGDWGSIVARALATNHSKSCRGIHINMVAMLPPSDEVLKEEIGSYSDEEKGWLGEAKWFADNETGYQRIQQSKPQTLGHGLSDSPVGLLAWIVEKFHGWVDLRGEKDLPPTISKDHLLTNVMIYYITNSITPSTRLYYESIHAPGTLSVLATPTPSDVAVGVAVFPKEIYKVPKKWCERGFPGLCHYEVFTSGGHFAALEEPEALIGEIKSFGGNEKVLGALKG